MTEFSVQRAGNMWRRGRVATLQIGPFGFEVNTADEGAIGFAITVGRWSWGWFLMGEERPQ